MFPLLSLSFLCPARVTQVTDATIRIDANQPMAGKTYQIQMTCHARTPPSSLSQATFAAGCFWGLELAFQRVSGVVYTAVGYTQGNAFSILKHLLRFFFLNPVSMHDR